MNKNISERCFVFLQCTRYILENLTLNTNHLVIQTHHSMLELYSFEFIVFVLLSYIFSRCIKKEKHVYFNFLNLISVTSWKRICVIQSYYYFPCSWMSFTCLYLNNNRLILFFILCSVNNSLSLMIKSISYFNLLLITLGKLKWIVFGSVIITSLLSQICIPITAVTFFVILFCWYKKYSICQNFIFYFNWIIFSFYLC